MRGVLWVVLALMLAGCSAPPSADEVSEDLGLDEDLVATEDTGIIRGVVVDSAIAPVASAEVTVLGDGRTATTNANGAFGFDSLPAATYFLKVVKPGYEEVQVSTDVVAGEAEPPVLKVQLARNPSTSPYVQVFQFQGHMACSLSYIALCGLPVVQDAAEDRFLATFTLDGPPMWINMESVWEGTQPTGDQMNLNMGRTPAGPGTTCCTAQGPSPLLVTANQTVIADGGIGTEGDLVGRMFSWEMEGTGIDDHTGQCVPVPTLTTYCQGPGVALDQDFELFVHAFYNFVPRDGWRFTVEGSPDVPA